LITQYADVNTGPADYHDGGKLLGMLLVTKIFGVTIQGEGPLAGTPAIFIRLAGCNKGDKVSCPWCDTDFRYANGTMMNTTDVILKLNELFSASMYGNKLPLVVMTGGEPMLQHITGFVEFLLKVGWTVQIESNGDRLAEGFSESSLCSDAMLVVSPKVNPSSKRYPRLKQEVFNRADYLKFVVEANPDSPYHTIPPYVFEWNMRFRKSSRVYVSPVTAYKRPVDVGEIASIWTPGLIDVEETQRNYTYAAELCQKNGYRLSCQLHTLVGAE